MDSNHRIAASETTSQVPTGREIGLADRSRAYAQEVRSLRPEFPRASELVADEGYDPSRSR